MFELLPLVAVGAVLFCVTLAPGIYLWWPLRADPLKRTDLGLALTTGAVIAFGVLALQVAFDVRLQDREERREAADQDAMSIQFLGLYRDLSHIDLSGRNLRGSYFRGKRLDFAAMARADLSRAIFVEASLEQADLTDATLEGIRATNTSFKGANLETADLTEAVFSAADLTDAFLVEARLHRADLTRARLVGAFLSGADLSMADLSGADLSMADLSGADLRGADLTDASLKEAAFEGVLYDAKTRWPRGFTPPPSG